MARHAHTLSVLERALHVSLAFVVCDDMPSPPIQVFLTSIASQPALRQRQEYILRILQVKKIPFTSYDLASDEDAKKLWRRKAPAGILCAYVR